MAPNANSRMMKVSGIVSDRVESRPLLISALMSSLMNVLLMAWIARSGLAARASARIGRTGAMSGVTRSLSPSIRPTIRTVDPSGETSPADGGAVNGSASWLKVGVWAPSSGAPEPCSAVTRSLTAVLKAGSAVAPGGAADDDDDLLERVVRAARIEDVVGLARLDLLLVRVGVRVGGVDPAHRQADREETDRRDEPQCGDRPAVPGAPHRDPDGRRLATRVLTGGCDGHPGSLRRRCFHHDLGLGSRGREREEACCPRARAPRDRPGEGPRTGGSTASLDRSTA